MEVIVSFIVAVMAGVIAISSANGLIARTKRTTNSLVGALPL